MKNLKGAITCLKMKETKPNFSDIGLDNQSLLELSKQIGTYAMSNQINIYETQEKHR